jgi:hypothetical protein
MSAPGLVCACPFVQGQPRRESGKKRQGRGPGQYDGVKKSGGGREAGGRGEEKGRAVIGQAEPREERKREAARGAYKCKSGRHQNLKPTGRESVCGRKTTPRVVKKVAPRSGGSGHQKTAGGTGVAE